MNDTLDYNDLKEGYQVQAGKSFKIAEWKFRKDEREFEALCTKLRAAKWYRAMKAEGGPRWKRAVARWTKTNNERRDQKLAEFEASLVVRECPTCASRFLPSFQPGMPKKYCTRKCGLIGWKRDHKERTAAYQRKYYATHYVKVGPKKVVCEHCRAEFVQRSNAKYCSLKCGRLARYVAKSQSKVVCAHCHAEFQQPRSGTRFCGRRCRDAARREKHSHQPASVAE